MEILENLENLEPLLQTFWYVAIPTSVFFILQTIMTFVGAESSHGIGGDFHGDLSGGHTPFELFSLRNLVNFLLGFSWSGISFYASIPNKTLLIVLSLLVGGLFVQLFFLIIVQMKKLEEDNSFKISNTLNKTAEVYLTIPENKKGKGKIMISVNGAFHELEAMTENDKIQTGTIVRVVKIDIDNILIVETI
jgi:hypothetical protein